PAVVIRPIWFPVVSVNHRAPSAVGPAAIPVGPAPAVMPAENSLMVLVSVVMFPTRSEPNSVNHRLPSGPAAIPVTWLAAPLGTTADSVTVPVGVIRPIRP